MGITWHFLKGIETGLEEKVRVLIPILVELNLESISFEYCGFNKVEIKIWKTNHQEFHVTLEDENEYDRQDNKIHKKSTQIVV